MKPVDFEYAAPGTVAEAVELLRRRGAAAKVLAGGQSLVPLLNMRLARPELVVDIARIPGLDGVADDGDALRIGALTRHRALERSPVVAARLPLLAAAARWIGHAQIRNRGTLGGSLVHADPAAELPLVAVALDARIEAVGPAGRRVIPASEFFLGYFTTSLAEDELVTAVEFPVWEGPVGWSFQEVARRHGDFALVAAAVQVRMDAGGRIIRAAVALGGAGPVPVRLAAVEARLQGQIPSPELISAAAGAVAESIAPESDLHASAEYRRDVAAVLVRRALAEATGQKGES